jgi:ribosomal protein L11 methyltransferase
VFPDADRRELEEGWEDRWRDFHRPVRVGSLWVGPPWERPPEDAVSVVIDPGRAFGTGAHPTTRLCLEFLLELPRSSLLDVGCGSGVLAIAAARLGFSPVRAVDFDPAAVEATRANAESNGVEVEVWLADATTDELRPAEVALLNVSAETVAEVAPRLASPLVVASGYLAGDNPVLSGFRSRRRVEAEGWAADLLARESAGPLE